MIYISLGVAAALGSLWWAFALPTWYSILIAVLMCLVVAVGVTIISSMHVA